MSTVSNGGNGGVLIALGEDASTELAIVGGKGASLGRLVKAGFPVPPGFVIRTDAYAECIRANELEAEIGRILAELDFGNLDDLEEKSARIREAILACRLPDDLAGVIVSAYEALGDQPYVAVRSSGTAEDLEGASFAGQYDTYLDIRGGDALLDAVLRCWASMWTARVTAYRQDKGFDQAEAGIAVVVQAMVEPDVAGVMFIGNPMNARADETLINASWGLGEAVVSGAVTPDEYIVGRDLEVKRRTLGGKELRVVRNQETGNGTVKEAVPVGLRGEHTLSDAQLGELTDLGRRVADYYEGLPQDTEWALAAGTFYLLQSRPVTGVDFTWEEDLDLWPELPEDEGTIWTRSWADEVWTGAITPLMWSVRGHWMKVACVTNYPIFEMEDLAELRAYTYWHGAAYYNTRSDALIGKYMLPPALREPLLTRLHPSQMEEAMSAPFDLERCIAMILRIEETEPRLGIVGDLIRAVTQRGDGPSVKAGFEARRARVRATVFPDEEELRGITDDDLAERIRVANLPFGALGGWSRIFIYTPTIRSLLEGVLKYWYDGDNENAYTELISGLPDRTQQSKDDFDFWKLAEMIRQSETLSALIEEFKDAAFFEELKNHEEGRAFLERYDDFLEMNFYRGHADRDMYYPRRVEDPSIDYDALRQLAGTEGLVSPIEREEKLNERRLAATAEVVANIEKQPMGALKLKIFNFLLERCLKSFAGRDNSRPMSDVVTWNKKVLIKELGQRTIDRGLLEGERDYWFLSLQEIYDLLGGKHSQALARAKVAGRMKGFDRFLSHEEDPPMFLQDGVPMLDGASEAGNEGVVRGVGTSPGTVTARARIIATQKDISLLEKGDILVCHGTDPGWTLAFSLVSGVVAQTGGAIAHFSCLSREYGIPAVSLPGAMKLIEDGSIITVNGGTGEVQLAQDSAKAEEIQS
ncbi:MAG: PEP/pyruvate-binding domain-containing protein [Pseudomonadales bacterium]|jgi:pyruvate,water dikinase|nr:PEP/pyruvate-binding domain-containing protein [Pseudomonadales bacterium]MDP7357569.1 PEP/pyruvate-binding domain-containing protein [Pseudomonadales bacterium]MDP7596543.1 PEP/pyruvate-binding domain-containing protein [Pseudomonadales bacterium]HJN51068.1 PEP/pyruvate-binding domain-containing protein [Pseudomonadales bacterium]